MPPLWDGHASERIADIVVERLLRVSSDLRRASAPRRVESAPRHDSTTRRVLDAIQHPRRASCDSRAVPAGGGRPVARSLSARLHCLEKVYDGLAWGRPRGVVRKDGCAAVKGALPGGRRLGVLRGGLKWTALVSKATRRLRDVFRTLKRGWWIISRLHRGVSEVSGALPDGSARQQTALHARRRRFSSSTRTSRAV